MQPESALTIDSPVGRLRLVASTGGALIRIEFAPDPMPSKRPASPPVLAQAADQLNAYFAGTLHQFDLPLATQGTPFQVAVWNAVAAVPYGETAAYGEIARRLGKSPGSSRAVGAANGQNPIPIIVPCHRIVGGNGDLTGYAGGLPNKEILLALERRNRPGPGQSLFGD